MAARQSFKQLLAYRRSGFIAAAAAAAVFAGVGLTPTTAAAGGSATGIISSVAREPLIRSQTFNYASAAAKSALIMHNPYYVPANTSASLAPTAGGHVIPPMGSISYRPLTVQFSTLQMPPQERQLSALMAQKIAKREHFYGIEITARSYRTQISQLDYGVFGKILPLFTSLVWLGRDYAAGEIEDIDALNLAKRLRANTVVLPHFTCYCVTRTRLEEFLNLGFSNVLALQGDTVDDEQEFKHTSDLIEAIREIRGGNVSIGVGGYPDLHPSSKTLEQDLEFLKKKIDAGADFIITQLTLNAQKVIDFVKNCRKFGINVPILVGVLVPESMRVLDRILEISSVPMEKELHEEFKKRSADHKAFQDFSVKKAVEFVTAIRHADVGIYGLQFYTMNRLNCVLRVIKQLFDKSDDEIDNNVET